MILEISDEFKLPPGVFSIGKEETSSGEFVNLALILGGNPINSKFKNSHY